MLTKQQRYKKLGIIGSGGYGTIYHGIDILTNKQIAIKEESTKDGSGEQLEWEKGIYDKMNGIKILDTNYYWPKAYSMFTTQHNKKQLIMELLGPSIDSLFKV